MNRAILVAALLATVPAFAAEPSRIAPKDAPSTGDVAPASEPGERLVVSGTVFAADGKTPVAGASLYVYQTDAKGHYRLDDPMGNRNPRLFALLRSDADGKYSYRTIRPASYPGTRVVQHIHYEVTAAGHGTRIFEIVFDDDPVMTDEVRRRAREPDSIYSLRKVEPLRDVGRVAQDVVLPAR